MPGNDKTTRTIYTIGHSTHPIDDFISLLKENGVKRLVDIRTIPRSRHNPQFEQEALATSLEAAGIEYRYMKDLGGLRPKVKESKNTAWRNASFRNYADYMQTTEFSDAITELIRLAEKKKTAIMCAEAVPWRCHRSLVGDALLVRGFNVIDIMGAGKTKEHQLTSFAVVDGKTILYPGGDDNEESD
jgi:uncharacterized protein (DUF488 family)